MNMPKTFLVASALTLGFLTQFAVAKDTEEDMKLREALRERMAEVGTAPAAPVAPAPPAAPAQVTAPELPAPPVVAPVAAPVAKPTSSAPVPSYLTAPVGQDDPETARMRDALRARIEQEGPLPEPVVAVAPAPAPSVAAPTVATWPPVTRPAVEPSGYVPLEAPAMPIAGTKEQRLQQLLQQYKADQITPKEYHEQRARIIAE